LETQVLVRDSSGAVYGATYKWRADNSDAEMITAGTSEDIAITNAAGVRTQTWYYASPADCLTCHTPGAGYVLGINTRQLNCNFTYPATGNADNQIRTWNRLGVFSPAINESKINDFTKLVALTDTNAFLADRARSYFDVNCSECHRPGGVGNYDARYETPLAGQRIINAPAAVTLGLNDARIVKQGDKEHSVLYRRITSVAPAVKMPPLAHNQVDAEAARVIGEWINTLGVKPAE
jgi:mono/diheme cytochrome c family protein